MTAAYELVKRPTAVLCHMPQSCNRVYDVLATAADKEGRCSLSLTELGSIAQIGRQTVSLAMKRLIASRLVDRRKTEGGRWPRIHVIRAFLTARKRDKQGKRQDPLKSYPQVDAHTGKSYPQVDAHMAKSYPQVDAHMARSGSYPQIDVYTGEKPDRIKQKYHSAQSYPQVDAHPSHYKESQKSFKSLKASKDVSTSTVTSPGKVMWLARNVVKNNASLSDQEKKTVISALGKAVFKRGYLSRFQQQPAALRELLNLLAQPRPPGKPPRKAAAHSVYGWMFGLIASIVTKHELGIGALMRHLQTHVTSQKEIVPTWAR